MNNYNDIKRLQPKIVKNIKDFDEIAKGQAKAFERIDKRVDKLYNNSFLISLELDGVERLEEIYNLEPLGNYEIRRNTIIAYRQSRGKLSATKIKNMAYSYGAERVEVSFNKKTSILEVEMIFKDGISLEVNMLLEIIEELKPARLAINYEFITERNTEIQLQTHSKEYEVLYPMCGTFKCGTKPYTRTDGISFNTQINVNTNKTNISQRYPMTGTFKGGEIKL